MDQLKQNRIVLHTEMTTMREQMDQFMDLVQVISRGQKELRQVVIMPGATGTPTNVPPNTPTNSLVNAFVRNIGKIKWI